MKETTFELVNGNTLKLFGDGSWQVIVNEGRKKQKDKLFKKLTPQKDAWEDKTDLTFKKDEQNN